MKHPTLQKVSLLTVALVASLALCAQARDRASISSAVRSGKAQHHQPAMNAKAATHGSNSISSTYVIDDGTMEDSVGFGDGFQSFQSVWVNQFAVIPGQTTITAVEVIWGTPNFPQSIDGTPVTIGVWSDPNGDGNPSDAALLGSVAGTVQQNGTDTPITYTFSPAVTLPAGATSFFLGDLTPANPVEEFFQGIDEDSTLHRQSWVVANGDGSNVDINNLGNNDLIGIIDDFGLPGNWGIRGDTGNGTPTPTPTATPTPTCSAVLWYNGDFDFIDGLTNEDNTSLGSGFFAHVYDDFNVPAGPGWDVGGVFSDNLSSTNITGATWEIRQGVSSGNGGTLIASGMTVTPIVTPTGRNAFGFDEFMVEVDGLSVHLDAGTYHLNVTPIGDLTGRSFDSTTSGANCVGTPCGTNDNAFLDSNFFGATFEPVADFGSQFHDFSMGVLSSGDCGGGITLNAKLRIDNGRAIALLRWSPANGGPIKVLRDGRQIGTTQDDGKTMDKLGRQHGTFTYQVCEPDTGTCSNEVDVNVP